MCCIPLYFPTLIKAMLEKGSGHSPLEGIATPFPTRTRLCLGLLFILICSGLGKFTGQSSPHLAPK